MKRGTYIALGIACSGCGMLGGNGGEPGPSPLGGTGLFRFLTRDETGFGDPEGRVFLGPAGAIDGISVASGELFFAGAAALVSPPAPADPPILGEPDWSQFGPRTIARVTSEDPLHFEGSATTVLEAEVPWEGSEVFDPWVVRAPTGETFLYYAAEDGIGVAVADGADGAFERPIDEPIIDAAEGEPLRRPSALVTEAGEFLLYYERDGEIDLARSPDGLVFEVIGPVIAPTEEEARVGSPGTVRITSPIDRSVIRMYFERTRTDGTVEIQFAASDDGVTFERSLRSVIDAEGARFPVPTILDDRSTLLYLVLPHTDLAGSEVAAVAAAMLGEL